MLLIDDILANSVSFFLEGRGGEGAGWRGSCLSFSLSYRDDWMTRLLFTKNNNNDKRKKQQTVMFSFGLGPFLLCSAAAENMAVIPEWLGI